MSLLAKVQSLSGDCHKQLIQFYESPEHRFPIEVRNLFPQQIEVAICGSNIDGIDGGLNPCNPNHSLQINEFLSNLISGIENRIAGNADEFPFFIQHKLTEAVSDFKTRMATNSLDLFQTIRECIDFEITLVKVSTLDELNGLEQQQQTQPIDQIMADVQDIRRQMATTGEIISRIFTEQEAFEINCSEKQTMDDYLVRIQTKQLNGQTQDFENSVKEKITIVDSKLQANVSNLLSLSVSFEKSVESNLIQLSKLCGSVLIKIRQWKYEQQLQANGGIQTNPVCLKKLQVWCEELADLIWSTRQQLKEAERLQSHNPVLNASPDCQQSKKVTGFIIEVTRLLSELLSGSFLVENQPPQVMKLGTRFPTPLTLSLLVGNRLNVQMTSPAVTTCIISEAQARALYQSEASINNKIVLSGDIANGNSKLEFNRDAKRLIANFRSMQLKRIKRADKKGGLASESVMEEKFCLLFESVVTVGDLNMKIWTFSLPVVVISHGSQEAQAVATITWDNAFGELGRVPFQVPQKVTWDELGKVLSLKFESLTGRGLTEDHLRCLKQKAFRYGSHSEFITWSEFCKDNLPDRHFSFWDWFYAALKIIERKDTHLKELWKDNLIVGFIERQTAESLLKWCKPGTFLLRFSDSLAGAITIAWIHEDSIVYLVNPFQLHDLTRDKLADSLNGLDHIKYLYPDMDKDQAFGKHYSPPTPIGPVVNPYVKPKMILQVPGSSRIGSGTPTVTPGGTRSNSLGSIEPWNMPYTFPSEHDNNTMETVMHFEEATRSPDYRRVSSPVEASDTLFPNFSVLRAPMMMINPSNYNDGNVTNGSSVDNDVSMEEQFSDLLKVIHSEIQNTTSI